MRIPKKIPLFILCFFLFLFSQAQERITDFSVKIQLDTVNQMTVQEDIAIVAEGVQFRRGLIREIPYVRRDKLGNLFQNPIEVISVTQDGQESEYHTSDKSGSLEIKIGSADKFLTLGSHVYRIVYTISNQVGYFDDYDEIYWNVTGNEWDFEIEKASCEVLMPEGSNASILRKACYTGLHGGTTMNCSSEVNGNNAFFTAINLGINEGLTVAVGFSKGAVQPPPVPGFAKRYGVLGVAILFILGILGYMAYAWYRHGRDPVKPTVIPQFAPPQGLSPAKVGFYSKKKFEADLLTVSLVSLATKGFIKIKENNTTTLYIFKDTTYTLEKLKDDKNYELPVEEAALLKSLFTGGKKSITANGTYQATFSTAKSKFAAAFTTEQKELSDGQNLKFLWVPILLLVAFWVVIGFYNLASSIMSVFWVFGLLLVPVFLAIPLFILASIFRINLRFAIYYKFFVVFMTAICMGIVLMGIADFSFDTKVIVLFSLMVMLLLLAYAYLIKRPQDKTVTRAAEIEGFAMYLKTAEEKLLQHYNPPTITPALFEQLLPYALALDLDKIWGEKFQKVLDLTSEGVEYHPSWYVGSNFSGNNFRSISNDITSTVGASSTAPSTSSSSSGGGSWSSGSSGGGSSGGGGGGGGGGGW